MKAGRVAAGQVHLLLYKRGDQQQQPADANMAPSLKGVFPKFALKQLSPYMAFIVIFIHNVVLDRDFECSCRNQMRDCFSYIALPTLILFFLQLWMDNTFQRTGKYTCPGKCNIFCCVILYHCIKALFISLLWVVYVFIDGDWYVCCLKATNSTESSTYPDFACKDKNKDITLDERKLIAELRTSSLVSFSFFKS